MLGTSNEMDVRTGEVLRSREYTIEIRHDEQLLGKQASFAALYKNSRRSEKGTRGEWGQIRIRRHHAMYMSRKEEWVENSSVGYHYKVT